MARRVDVDRVTHTYRQALRWAQVFAHYPMLLPADERRPDGYTAERVQRIIDKPGRSGVAQVMPDVAKFIALHDATIRACTRSHFDARGLRPRRKKALITPNGRFAPPSGIANYLLVFNRDSSLTHAWLLDASSDPALRKNLRHEVSEMMIPLKAGDSASKQRHARMPATYDDHRYRVAPSQ